MGRSTKVAAMMRAEEKKNRVEREGDGRGRRAVGRRWRPSLSSIAEEETVGDGGAAAKVGRACPTPAAVKLKTPRGGAYFAVSVAKARLWNAGEFNNPGVMSFGRSPFVF